MKVKLLVARDGCDVGAVVDFGYRAARALIAARQAVAYVESPPEVKIVQPKARKPEPAKAPEAKEH